MAQLDYEHQYNFDFNFRFIFSISILIRRTIMIMSRASFSTTRRCRGWWGRAWWIRASNSCPGHQASHKGTPVTTTEGESVFKHQNQFASPKTPMAAQAAAQMAMSMAVTNTQAQGRGGAATAQEPEQQPQAQQAMASYLYRVDAAAADQTAKCMPQYVIGERRSARGRARMCSVCGSSAG